MTAEIHNLAKDICKPGWTLDPQLLAESLVLRFNSDFNLAPNWKPKNLENKIKCILAYYSDIVVLKFFLSWYES